MWQRFIKPVPLLYLILLAGCATAPQVETVQRPPVSALNAATDADVDAEFKAAVALMKADRWEAAAEKLAAITVTDSQLSGAWTNLGIARNMLGDQAGAEAALRQAIAVNSSQVAAYSELALLCRRSGRLEEAAAIYNQGLAVNPNSEDIHWNLAVLYDQYLTEPVLALQHYERYQQLTGSEDRFLLSWIDELRDKASQVSVAAGAKQ
ncbi:MAG: tetratricopeptide repeat protein [Pseudomonadota bacterium]